MDYSLMNERRKLRIQQGRAYWNKLLEMSKAPMAVQEKFLMKILDDNKDTEIGKKYGFGSIHSIREFQEAVPLTNYDDYAPYIERMTEKGERGLLSINDPVYYNKSSGTIGVPKRIPYSEEAKNIFNITIGLLESAVIEDAVGEKYYTGRGINLIQCGGSLKKLPDGLFWGPISEAGLLVFRERWRNIFTSPLEASFAGPGTNTRYLHARFALEDPEASYILFTYAGFALEMCRYIEKNWEMIVKDIEQGTIDESVEIPEQVRASLMDIIKPLPERAAFLRSVFEKGFEEPFIPKVWPMLSYVYGGATGGFKDYARKLQERYLGPDIVFFRRGVSASEGAFSQSIEIDSCDSVLLPDSVFFEFIPEADDEPDMVHLLTLDQLEVGKKYELVITNLSGFYRYRMKDVFLVTGMCNNLPFIEYQYRSDRTVDLMGEKTTEAAVRAAAEDTATQCGFDLIDVTMYPDPEGPCYTYLLEAEKIPASLTEEQIRDCLEENLRKANPSMSDKLNRGFCKPTKLYFLQPETFLLYRDMIQMKGLSAAQMKPVTVIANEQQRRFFFGLREDFEEIGKKYE